jgi:hypothetical protein
MKSNIIKPIAQKLLILMSHIKVRKQFANKIPWKSNRLFTMSRSYQWNWYYTSSRFAKFRGSNLPIYNLLTILRLHILYSFFLHEFSLMVSHKRFLMRQYKHKCPYMPYHFLLVLFPLGFKGVFNGIYNRTLFPYEFSLKVSHNGF